MIDYKSLSIGLIVDSVCEVLAIPDEEIVDKPEINSRGGRGYISSIGKIGERVILLLDCEKLMSAEELELIASEL